MILVQIRGQSIRKQSKSMLPTIRISCWGFQPHCKIYSEIRQTTLRVMANLSLILPGSLVLPLTRITEIQSRLRLRSLMLVTMFVWFDVMAAMFHSFVDSTYITANLLPRIRRFTEFQVCNMLFLIPMEWDSSSLTTALWAEWCLGLHPATAS
jgi:hypothetical protein